MTANEIIKILNNELECIKRQFSGMCDNKRDCGKCDLALPDNVVISAYENVLDLINRQKTEIERLEKENEKQKVMLGYIEDEMFPLPFGTDFDKAIKQVKSEAIKEFAVRLKSEYEDEKQGRYIDWLMSDSIDNLVKEMTEEKS